MSGLEKKIFIAMVLFLPTIYFIPELWEGIFNAKTSNASKLYVVGIIAVLGNAIMLSLFSYVSVEAFLKRIKQKRQNPAQGE